MKKKSKKKTAKEIMKGSVVTFNLDASEPYPEVARQADMIINTVRGIKHWLKPESLSVSGDYYEGGIVSPSFKPEPKIRLWKKLLPALLPLALALGVMGLLRLKDGPPAEARYRIKPKWGVVYDYSAEKPQILAGDCIFWTDLKGQGQIFCGDVKISEVPGRISHE